MPKEDALPEPVRKRALNISTKDGAASASSVALGDNYISLFALELKAQPFTIGIISALAGLLGPLAQLFSNYLMQHDSRKNIARRTAFLQGLLWIPLALIAVLYWRGIAQPLMLPLLILCYALIVIAAGMLYPAWFSWMGDLVKPEERGKYFSRRTRIAESVALSLFLISGFVLDAFKTSGKVLLGFALFFIAASIARFITYLLLSKQYEPRFTLRKSSYFSFVAFLRRMDNYGKFAVSYALFNFAIMIASPFFTVYMRQELQFSYTFIVLITLSSSVFYLLFTPFVGRFSDRFGNRNLFYLAAVLFSLNPLLWIFITNPWGLVFLPQLIVGLANAALMIGIVNFTYDAASPQHRSLCVTYTNILAGIGTVAGSLLGGFLLSIHLPFAQPFVIVFSLAALLRLAIPLFFIRKLKEVRKVEPLHTPNISILHPFRTFSGELHWIRSLMHEKQTQEK